MGDGVTTGQQLNSFVLRTRGNMKAADRGKGTGGAYTRLSRQYNGFLPNVSTNYARDHKCCNGGYNDTMMKLQQGMQLFNMGAGIVQQGIGMFGGLTNNRSVNNNNSVQNTNVVQNTDLGALDKQISTDSNSNLFASKSTSSNASLESVLSDIELSGDTCISQMKEAKTSKDLFAAIGQAESHYQSLCGELALAETNATNAKTQLDNLDKNKTLDKLENDRDKAKEDLNRFQKNDMPNIERGYEKAKSDLRQAEDDLAQKDEGYKTALGKRRQAESDVTAAGKDVKLQEANLNEKKKLQASAVKDLETATSNKAKADQAVTDATTLESTTKTSYEAAEKAYEAAAADAPNKAALKVAMDQAKSAWDAATQKLETAKAEQKKAKEAFDAAYSAKGKADQAVSDQERVLSTSKSTLEAKNKVLKEAKDEETQAREACKNSSDLLKGAEAKVTTCDTELQKAEGYMDTAKKTLEAKERAYNDANTAYEDMKTQKATWEGQIEKYKNLKSEHKELGEKITEYRKKCEKMQKDEQKEIAELNKDIDKKGKKSDEYGDKVDEASLADGSSSSSRTDTRNSKKMMKNEDKQNELINKRNGILASHHSGQFAWTDLSTYNLEAELDAWSSGITNGGANYKTIGGIKIQMSDNKYIVNGQTYSKEDLMKLLLPKYTNIANPSRVTTKGGNIPGVFS